MSTARVRIRTILALVAVNLPIVISVVAQDNSDPARICQGQGKQQYCNGISVGAPKAFDNRTLTLMLESLSQTLQSQQQNYIDQKSIAAALANIQGFSQTESATNLSLTTTPTPATDVKTTLNTGNVSSTGAPLPNTFQRQTDVSRASVTPTAPTLDTAPAFQGFTPNYGSSASDLLSDQVNLTYQIFNLRMILERALSDRLLQNGRSRRQAVLGFNITIDPPRTANDAVAVVEITLCTLDRQKCEEGGVGTVDVNTHPLSLVALMPQEKTYNAAALSSKSNAFAGSAVVSSLQVGFSARRRGQIFYLYRDNDTISYERMTSTPGKIVFGWMFRPVLGRRSVSPGLRQLFAIAALPDDDYRGADCLSPCAGKGDVSKSFEGQGTPLVTNVRTYWKKYDRGTLTSFEHRDANVAKKFWYGLSLSLATPQIFHDRNYENFASYEKLIVGRSTDYENDLRPTLTNVTWRPTGAKNIIISAKGENFFSGTSVALGDKSYADGSGLTLKSNQAFDLVTTLDALVNGPGTILGRYGNGVPLTSPANRPNPCPEGDDESAAILCLRNGVEVAQASMSPAISGLRQVDISLQGKPSDKDLIKAKQASAALSQATPIEKVIKAASQSLPTRNAAPNVAASLPDADKKKVASDLKSVAPVAPNSHLAPFFGDQLDQFNTFVKSAAKELDQSAANNDRQLKTASAKSALDKFYAAKDELTEALNKARAQFSIADQGITAAHPLQMLLLPVVPGTQNTIRTLESPVVSINGTPLELPYEFADVREKDSNGRDVDRVLIRVYVKDSLIGDSGGGIVKVSWPFYPQHQWTTTYRFYNPDLAFVVTRLDSKHVIINRIDGPSFTKAPEIDNDTPACWSVIVADGETLSSKDCPKNNSKNGPSDSSDKPKPQPALKSTGPKPAAKPKTSDCQENTGCPLASISDYALLASAKADLPDKVVFVGPNKAIYNLTVPPVKPKDDKPAPIELNQFDSEWIQVKASDLTSGPGTAGAKTAAKPPDDFSTLTSVTANGKPVNSRPQKVDPKAINPKTGKPYPPTMVEIEITRALTSNPGVVQVGFFAGTDLLGTRQIHITQTQWDTEGEK